MNDLGFAVRQLRKSPSFTFIAAVAATRLLNSLLFGVGASDPLTFGAIVLLIFGVAFLAAWLPARRALQVDPIVALRAE